MLEDEQKLILRVVRTLPEIQQRIDKGDVDREVLLSVVDFFREYAEKAHHAKEETALFPLLENRGVPSDACPIGALRNEHNQGRKLTKVLEDAVQRYGEGDSDATGQIAGYLRRATDFYTTHVWKGEFLLFPLARKVLSDSDQDFLLKEFISLDSKLGHHFQEEYYYRVSRLESILKGDGKINHPWGPHTRLEEPSHLLRKLEEILQA